MFVIIRMQDAAQDAENDLVVAKTIQDNAKDKLSKTKEGFSEEETHSDMFLPDLCFKLNSHSVRKAMISLRGYRFASSTKD